MKRTLKTILAGMMIWSATVMPAAAQEWMDATHLFEDETKWLADNALKETRGEYMLRTRGMVMYADSKPAEVGDEVTFTTMNVAEKKPEKTPAVLKKIGKHCYVFVEKGKTVSAAAIEKIVKTFDEKIYPTNTSTFGSEWKPGIDGDEKITLLFLDIKDGYQKDGPNKGYVAGYFYAGDEYSKEKNPQSNEREMLYLDIDPADPTKESYLGVVAHEFQHMIHWHNDPKEHTWVNESMSQLATFLNGFDHPSQVFAFIKAPDNNMCAWSQETPIANYGQVYLFAYYMMNHAVTKTDEARKQFIRDLVESDVHGTDGYERTLKKHGGTLKFSQYFDAFNVANHLNDPRIASGLYGYDKNLGKLKLDPMIHHKNAPFTGKGTVKCWSSRSVTFDISKATGKITVAFAGQTQKAEENVSNAWSVAAVMIDSKGKAKTGIEWLKLKAGKGEQQLETSAGVHDTLMLVFVNRGHEGGDMELAFAKAVPPAPFAYSVGLTGGTTAVAAARRTTVKPRTSARRTTVRRSIEEMAARKPLGEEMARVLSDGSNVIAAITNSAVNNEYENQKNEETALFEDIRQDVIDGKMGTLVDFVEVWKAAGVTARENLAGLRTRLIDFLRFESMQNNRTDLDAYITDLTA
ncbi:MAG TPA: hypothetical protein PLU72_11430 [Candidatus Ozemobacteraceae bacterium]|nr:hypothetical protein [Candidatus Ozemobacteraceae bacterium]